MTIYPVSSLACFGVSETPYYRVLSDASALVEGVSVQPLAEMGRVLGDRQYDVVILLGCDYINFIAQLKSQFESNPSFLKTWNSLRKKGLILCDSVKDIWYQFANQNSSLFDCIYPIDVPVDSINKDRGLKKAVSILGFPAAGHSKVYLERLESTDPTVDSLLSFCGGLSIYPERAEFLDTAIKMGLPLSQWPGKSYKTWQDQHREHRYEEYLDALYRCFYSLNFPRATKDQGKGRFHLKGRYYESLITGCINIEEANPILKLIPFEFPVVNYRDMAHLIELVRSKNMVDDYESFLKEKRKIIVRGQYLFFERRFFGLFFVT